MLTDKIQQDQIIALKAHDKKKLSTLRFLLSEIKNEQIDKHKELTDEDVVSVIRKQVKKLEDAAVLFEKGGRSDMVEDNKAQIEILQAYLPTEISDAELQSKIQKIISENQAVYYQNPKAIIGIAMGKLKSEASPSRIMTVLNSFQQRF